MKKTVKVSHCGDFLMKKIIGLVKPLKIIFNSANNHHKQVNSLKEINHLLTNH